MLRRLYFVVSIVLVGAAAACGPSSAADAPASSGQTVASPPPAAARTVETPAAGPATAPAAVEDPDGQRMLEWARDLSFEIGPRVSGQASEKEAADYIAAELRSFGYDVELQDFTVHNEAGRDARLSVGSSTEPIASVPFQGSAAGNVKGDLIAVPGKGEPRDFPAAARGAIVLVERGDLLFRDKIANARAAGAAGVIIYNNESGIFYGSLGVEAGLPAVSVSQAEGQRLKAMAQQGAVTAALDVDLLPQATSYNVVAKPPGSSCDTVSGGHYDSVPQAPGANDNASGTVTVMEIAWIMARSGRMGNNCFVLFGSEESGLLGSRAYVDSLSREQRQRLKAMFNFDMVAVGETWQLIGSTELQDRAAELANGFGVPVTKPRSGPAGASSDHASFLQAGIPALFLYRTNDPAWHQPSDTVDRLSPEAMETAARLGVALLESMSNGS